MQKMKKQGMKQDHSVLSQRTMLKKNNIKTLGGVNSQTHKSQKDLKSFSIRERSCIRETNIESSPQVKGRVKNININERGSKEWGISQINQKSGMNKHTNLHSENYTQRQIINEPYGDMVNANMEPGMYINQVHNSKQDIIANTVQDKFNNIVRANNLSQNNRHKNNQLKQPDMYTKLSSQRHHIMKWPNKGGSGASAVDLNFGKGSAGEASFYEDPSLREHQKEQIFQFTPDISLSSLPSIPLVSDSYNKNFQFSNYHKYEKFQKNGSSVRISQNQNIKRSMERNSSKAKLVKNNPRDIQVSTQKHQSNIPEIFPSSRISIQQIAYNESFQVNQEGDPSVFSSLGGQSQGLSGGHVPISTFKSDQPHQQKHSTINKKLSKKNLQNSTSLSQITQSQAGASTFTTMRGSPICNTTVGGEVIDVNTRVNQKMLFEGAISHHNGPMHIHLNNIKMEKSEKNSSRNNKIAGQQSLNSQNKGFQTQIQQKNTNWIKSQIKQGQISIIENYDDVCIQKIQTQKVEKSQSNTSQSKIHTIPEIVIYDQQNSSQTPKQTQIQEGSKGSSPGRRNSDESNESLEINKLTDKATTSRTLKIADTGIQDSLSESRYVQKESELDSQQTLNRKNLSKGIKHTIYKGKQVGSQEANSAFNSSLTHTESQKVDKIAIDKKQSKKQDSKNNQQKKRENITKVTGKINEEGKKLMVEAQSNLNSKITNNQIHKVQLTKLKTKKTLKK